MQRSETHAGFTLIELLIVIAIITVLAALLFPSLQKARNQAHISEANGCMRELSQLAANFGIDHMTYVGFDGTGSYAPGTACNSNVVAAWTIDSVSASQAKGTVTARDGNQTVLNWEFP